MVYGGERPVMALRTSLPGLRTVWRSGLKACLLHYFALGWSGIVPSACRHSVLLVVPVNYASWLWGWPYRFLERVSAADSVVFVLGPWDGEGFSRGTDTPAEFSRLPAGFSGGISTTGRSHRSARRPLRKATRHSPASRQAAGVARIAG